MLPNDNVSMSVGHLYHVLIVYSSMDHVTYLYKLSGNVGQATANRPHRTLRNFVVHPKDKVKDEEKTE